MSKKIKYQILAVVGVIIVAVLGSIFVNLGMEWFNSLIKPMQWISNIIIPIVWTIIYITSAVIIILLIKNNQMTLKSLGLFVLNGIFNILWCLAFFALHQTFIGLIVIIINLILGWLLFNELCQSNKTYTYIIVIYPIWLSIATTLNLCLWILN